MAVLHGASKTAAHSQPSQLEPCRTLDGAGVNASMTGTEVSTGMQ